MTRTKKQTGGHTTVMWNMEFIYMALHVSKIPSQFGTFAIYSLSVMRYIVLTEITSSLRIYLLVFFLRLRHQNIVKKMRDAMNTSCSEAGEKDQPEE